ncbi:MAG: flagellar assembly protein FliW [Actinobacteria bacterium]|nr:flagellar assembly protein FliW [Thermoleophilia bacterium]MCB9010704.1 flagellar assembly protein FliW [Actinomycetota bacterium]
MSGTTQTVGTGDMIAVQSQALGDIEVSSDNIIRFAEPVAGFPDCGDYALVPHMQSDGTPNENIMWLQALEVPFHAFIVTDPWSVMGDYSPEIPDADAEQLGLSSFEDARVLVILTVAPEGGVSVNLRAPIVFNVRERLGKQVVLLSDRYETRHMLGGAAG